jgi:hypothetical protein
MFEQYGVLSNILRTLCEAARHRAEAARPAKRWERPDWPRRSRIERPEVSRTEAARPAIAGRRCFAAGTVFKVRGTVKLFADAC